MGKVNLDQMALEKIKSGNPTAVALVVIEYNVPH